MKPLSLFSLVLSLAVAAAETSSFKPSFVDFASHEANYAAPHYDLTPWGYGHELPKVYDIRPGQNQTYLPDKSYEVFQEITSGRRNRTEPAAIDRAIIPETNATRTERAACQPIQMDVSFGVGDSAVYYGLTELCPTSDICWYNPDGSGIPFWDFAYIYSVNNNYVTFWTSNACNGAKGSVNPVCNTEDDYYCQLNRAFNSFRIYETCHQTDADDGCSESGPA